MYIFLFLIVNGIASQVVYILDQVRALENEMLLRIKQQGLDITPKILIVRIMFHFWALSLRCQLDSYWVNVPTCFYLLQVTRLLPDAVGTTCGQRLEKVIGTEHTDIIRVPFRNENGILRKWISRFDVWPYLETYTEVYKLILWLDVLHILACSINTEVTAFCATGCFQWNHERNADQAWPYHWKLQWWQLSCHPARAQVGCYSGLFDCTWSISWKFLSFPTAYGLVHSYSVPLPMPWRKPNTPTQTYTWTNSTVSITSHASSQLTLLPWITLISSSPVHSKKSLGGKLCILWTVGHECVAVTKWVSDACCVVFAARTLLGNTSPTSHLPFLGSTVLYMALMFLIPSSISSHLEQTWVFTTRTQKPTRDSLPSTLRSRSSFTVMLRTLSTSEYWNQLGNIPTLIFMPALGLSIY